MAPCFQLLTLRSGTDCTTQAELLQADQPELLSPGVRAGKPWAGRQGGPNLDLPDHVDVSSSKPGLHLLRKTNVTLTSPRLQHRGPLQVTAFGGGGLLPCRKSEDRVPGSASWSKGHHHYTSTNRVRPCATASCLLHSALMQAHFAAEETEAQRGGVTYPVLPANEWRKLNFQP